MTIEIGSQVFQKVDIRGDLEGPRFSICIRRKEADTLAIQLDLLPCVGHKPTKRITIESED